MVKASIKTVVKTLVKTFRWRLTLWYLGCFALLFFLLTAALYGVLSRALVGRLDEALVSQAATAASLFEDEMDESHGDVAASSHEAVVNMRLPSSEVALLDAAGHRLSASAPFDAVSAAASAGAAPQSSFAFGNLRVAVNHFRTAGRAYTAIAAEPMDGVEADLAAIRRA